MICYWCKAPDPPLAPPAMLREYAAVGMIMRRCGVCGHHQNHVGDDEPQIPSEVLKREA